MRTQTPDLRDAKVTPWKLHDASNTKRCRKGADTPAAKLPMSERKIVRFSKAHRAEQFTWTDLKGLIGNQRMQFSNLVYRLVFRSESSCVPSSFSSNYLQYPYRTQ